ncbi:hypothetical protein OIDMADRAFT_139842 [Oidiodendron maius Zn]|uniref:Uncharacterized protein n=1 Tax=Oidiodendron maius (strain Zn) TaxID=913774 RepID=A0A0C3D7A1_OIDMZ|nr:hypothetical protein OIDMADRAFT_139842 [Oidiodendron maius Zn]
MTGKRRARGRASGERRQASVGLFEAMRTSRRSSTASRKKEEIKIDKSSDILRLYGDGYSGNECGLRSGLKASARCPILIRSRPAAAARARERRQWLAQIRGKKVEVRGPGDEGASVWTEPKSRETWG